MKENWNEESVNQNSKIKEKKVKLDGISPLEVICFLLVS